MRGLLGPDRAAGRGRTDRMGGDQRLPGADRRARWPRGDHRRGAAETPTRCTRFSTRWRCAAARNAATARPGSSAAWRASTTAPTARRPADHGDAEHGPNGFDLHALSGNLCRCTGYRPIRDAAYALGEPADSDALAARSTQPAPAPVATRLSQDGLTFTRPATLAEAVEILHERPETTVIAGCTDHGVEVNLRGKRARGGARDRPPRGAAEPVGRLRLDRDRRRALAHRDRATASTVACRCSPSCFRSSPRG